MIEKIPTEYALIIQCIENLIEYMGPNEIGWFNSAGKPVTLKEMIQHLQVQDNYGQAFIEDVFAAATRTAKFSSKARLGENK